MNLRTFTNKVLIVLGLLLLILLIGFAAKIFLLAFAAIVIAVLLRRLSEKLQQWLHWKYAVCLGIVSLLILLLLAGTGYWMLPSLNEQISSLQAKIPEAVEQLKQQLTSVSWAHNIMEKIPKPEEIVSNQKNELFSIASTLFSATANTLVNAFVVLIIAVFLASDPVMYSNGIAKLFRNSRERFNDLLYKCYRQLGSWLKGKFLSMLVVGILTYIGLLLLGFPLALILSLIAMVLTFIPNVGPAIAMVPAALIGLIQGPASAFHVILLYIGVQILESYLITPIINKKAVSLPPALTLFWQILMGTFLGGLGLFLATPLLAVMFVLINDLYLKKDTQAA